MALIPACEKGDGYIINHGSAELKDCPIMQIIRDKTNYSPYGIIDTAVFVYNRWGDPVSITKSTPIWSGSGGADLYFTYDKKRRLIELVAFDPGAIPALQTVSRHKYFYDNPGSDNITRDSGFYVPGMAGVDFRSLTYYFYDKYDRVIKDSTFGPEVFTPLVYTYSYDGNGNRTSVKWDNHAGSDYTNFYSTYDSRTNFLRTHKIWMFLTRDYSVNNSFVAAGYNSKGLPTQLNLNNSISLGLWGGYGGVKNAQIKYGCR